MSEENKEKETEKEKVAKASKKTVKKRSTLSFAIEFFLKIIITAAAIWILLTFVVGIYIIHDNSGYPMIKDGDLCLIYRLGDLRDRDFVAYTVGGELHFGRIVATEGDVIDAPAENLTINGYGVYEDAVYPTPVEGTRITLPYTVPEGTYFILNDYRSDISDSRTYGAIRAENIKGKVVFVMRRRGI